MLIVLPPKVHKSLLVELLPSALAEAPTAHNRAQAVNWVFRPVDAKLLKAALASSSEVLAIIASWWFFDQVIRHTADGIPSTYRRVLVRAEDDTQPGWICLPGDQRASVTVTSPYKGLRPFEKEDENLFFGRENAVRQLMGAVATSALVPVVGKSGIGKSSLVQAGLLPLLEKTGWAVETILPRPALPIALAAALPGCQARPSCRRLSLKPGWTICCGTASPRPRKGPRG
jgi:hypothetical protein